MTRQEYETTDDSARLRDHAERLAADGKASVAAFWREMADRLDERSAQAATPRPMPKVAARR